VGNQEATASECYECGCSFSEDNPSYGSLMPRAPHFVERKASGEIIEAKGFNWDYRVCLPDYKKQFAEVYPGESMPLGVRKAEARIAASEAYADAMAGGE